MVFHDHVTREQWTNILVNESSNSPNLIWNEKQDVFQRKRKVHEWIQFKKYLLLLIFKLPEKCSSVGFSKQKKASQNCYQFCAPHSMLMFISIVLNSEFLSFLSKISTERQSAVSLEHISNAARQFKLQCTFQCAPFNWHGIFHLHPVYCLE